MLMKECCYLGADYPTPSIDRPDGFFLQSDEKGSAEKYKSKYQA